MRLLAAATALLQAKGSGWLHAYVSHILAKLRARSRAEIIRRALDRDTGP